MEIGMSNRVSPETKVGLHGLVLCITNRFSWGPLYWKEGEGAPRQNPLSKPVMVALKTSKMYRCDNQRLLPNVPILPIHIFLDFLNTGPVKGCAISYTLKPQTLRLHSHQVHHRDENTAFPFHCRWDPPVAELWPSLTTITADSSGAWSWGSTFWSPQ